MQIKWHGRIISPLSLRRVKRELANGNVRRVIFAIFHTLIRRNCVRQRWLSGEWGGIEQVSVESDLIVGIPFAFYEWEPRAMACNHAERGSSRYCLR
jgi:hypothetical protein